MWACWNHTESRSSGRVGAFIPHLQHDIPGDGRHIRQEGGETRGPHVKHKTEGLRRRRLDADDRAKIK